MTDDSEIENEIRKLYAVKREAMRSVSRIYKIIDLYQKQGFLALDAIDDCDEKIALLVKELNPDTRDRLMAEGIQL